MPSNATDARVRSRTNQCEICGGQSGSGTVLSPSTSVFPVSTSALTLSTHLRSGNCQKATFFPMLGNTGEKVLSLSSERVYYTHSHVRRVSAWCWTAVSFSLLSYMKCTGHVDRQTATATVLQPAWCLHLLRPCPEHDHCRCYVGQLLLSTVPTLEACLTFSDFPGLG